MAGGYVCGPRMGIQRSQPGVQAPVPVYSTPFLGVLESRLASEELRCALAWEVEELLMKDAIMVVHPS